MAAVEAASVGRAGASDNLETTCSLDMILGSSHSSFTCIAKRFAERLCLPT